MRFPPFIIPILALAGGIAVAAGLDRAATTSADRVPVAHVSPTLPSNTPSRAAQSSRNRASGEQSQMLRPALKRPPTALSHGEAPYSSTSPHWPWIRTMVTDFRTGYVSSASQRSTERSWAAAHFDFVMGGDAQQYKSLNPSIRVIPYALDWAVIQPGEQKSTGLATSYYGDMQQWYAAHPQFRLEQAFLHLAGSEASPATRLQFTSWGSKRWAINPGDSGARAYAEDRIRRFSANSDGVFFDGHASGDIGKALGKTPLAEYPDRQVYQRDLVEYLHDIAQAIAPKIVMINTAEYMKPFDYSMVKAAGAVHLERMNNPLNASMPERWRWVDTLLAQNVLVELVPLNSWAEANSAHGVFATYSRGNYTSAAERLKMFELASYYLVVPSSPDHLFLDLENAWKVPYDQVWLNAQEYDVGHPTGARHVIETGRDSTNNGFSIWAREFDHALILARPSGSWRVKDFDDSTAVSVPLPNGESLRPLHGDGTLGSPVTSVTLRNSEAMILVR